MLFIRLMFSFFVWGLLGLVCLIAFFPLAIVPLALFGVDMALLFSSRRRKEEERRHKEMLTLMAMTRGGNPDA